MRRHKYSFWQEKEGGPLVKPRHDRHPWYAKAAWKNGFRKVALQKNPVCCLCQRNPATVVDHIVPFINAEGYVSWALFSDPMNHRALCAPCHSRLTAEFDRGFGNPAKQGKESATTPIEIGTSGKIRSEEHTSELQSL